jgi:hypothetical protein
MLLPKAGGGKGNRFCIELDLVAGSCGLLGMRLATMLSDGMENTAELASSSQDIEGNSKLA